MLKYITEEDYKKLLGKDSIPDNFNNLVIQASSYIKTIFQSKCNMLLA